MREPVVRAKHVILVHGFFCNDGFWFQLAPKLLSDGYSVTGVEMSSVFSSIDQFTVLLEQEIGRCHEREEFRLLGSCAPLVRRQQSLFGLILVESLRAGQHHGPLPGSVKMTRFSSGASLPSSRA